MSQMSSENSGLSPPEDQAMGRQSPARLLIPSIPIATLPRDESSPDEDSDSDIIPLGEISLGEYDYLLQPSTPDVSMEQDCPTASDDTFFGGTGARGHARSLVGRIQPFELDMRMRLEPVDEDVQARFDRGFLLGARSANSVVRQTRMSSFNQEDGDIPESPANQAAADGHFDTFHLQQVCANRGNELNRSTRISGDIAPLQTRTVEFPEEGRVEVREHFGRLGPQDCTHAQPVFESREAFGDTTKSVVNAPQGEIDVGRVSAALQAIQEGGQESSETQEICANREETTKQQLPSADEKVMTPGSPSTGENAIRQEAPSAVPCPPQVQSPRGRHGHRALARLGFKPCEEVWSFKGSTRPPSRRQQPHSRRFIESYFSKMPLQFPNEWFNVKFLSDTGIHLEDEGERPLDFPSSHTCTDRRRRMYADPMPGHLHPGGLFASGPASPRKLKLGKRKDWHLSFDASEVGELKSKPEISHIVKETVDLRGSTLCIRGLDPFDTHALRSRLWYVLERDMSPDGIMLYPSLEEGDPGLVAYIRLRSEQEVEATLCRCDSLGLKAYRSSAETLLKIQPPDDEQMLQNARSGGCKMVLAHPMVPSRVLRRVQTQALEQIQVDSLSMDLAGRRTSGRTLRSEFSKLPTRGNGQALSPSGAESHCREESVLSPSTCLDHSHAHTRTLLRPALDCTGFQSPERKFQLQHAVLMTPKGSKSTTHRSKVGSNMFGSTAGIRHKPGTSSNRPPQRPVPGPSSKFVDLLKKQQTFAEKARSKNTASWSSALYDAPWGA